MNRYFALQEVVELKSFTKAAAGPETLVLKEGRLLAVLPENHPLAALGAVPLKELVQEPLILTDEGHYSDAMEALRAIGFSPAIKHSLQDDYAIMSMVELGMGVSILAEPAMRNTNYRVAIRRTEPPISRTVAVVYRDKASLSIASQRFIAHLQQRVADLP